MSDRAWMVYALCTQTDPEMFFPNQGDNANAAKRMCRACPVRAACLRYALDEHETYGIWGGTSERERQRMRPEHPTCRLCGRERNPQNRWCRDCAARRRKEQEARYALRRKTV